ncbi:MAG TPA: SWIM zinc finger family protein [Ktedonobacteraceae bacterium]|nr:SWIM zinc finger family protein [Ktedonobacteraceae bacterium]
MSTIPTLTEKDIRVLVSEQAFQQGRQYYHDGAIFDAFHQGMALKAYCHGSVPQPYRVQVTFDTTGNTTATCTCQGDNRAMLKGYYCKHVAALLLTWREQPEKFTKLDDVETLLERRSKSELIALITHILQQQPALAWDLLMPPPTEHKRNKPVDPQIYRDQVEAAFRNGGREWGAVKGISNDLYKIMQIGDGFAKEQDYVNATTVYEAVAMGTLERYTRYPDVDGYLGRVLNSCIDAIDEYIFDAQDDRATHEKCLQILFAIYRFSVDSGIDLGEEAPDVIVANVTSEERPIVAGWVRDALAQVQATDTHGSDKYYRQKYGKLLLDLEKDELDDETFLRISRETNNTFEAVERLLSRGRIDEAVKETAQVDDYRLLNMVEVFAGYGHDALIERVIKERATRTHFTRHLEWLKKRYVDRNDAASALEITEMMFHRYPHFDTYQEIRQLATQLGQWVTVRPKVLDFLQTSGNTGVLIYIALDDGEIDRALELVKIYQKQPQGYDHDRPVLAVAKAAEETRPHAAIEIYQQHIERLIEQKIWSGYHEACEYLLRVRALYEKLGEHETWTNYLTLLRQRYSRLRSLKAEMEAANLLS